MTPARARRRLLTATLAAGAAALALGGCGGATKTVTVVGSGAGSAATAGTGGAAELQARFVQVVHAVSPSVVQIETSQGLGSGVVFDGRGDVVTNAHVVGTSKTFTVTLSDGSRHQATLVGTYTPDDLAVVHIGSGAPKPVPFADSSKARVGELALALGNPLGLRSSVTDGIVSSLGRTVSEGNGAVITAAIQTSAPINPGNSGGALVDITGRVLGIPTLAATDPQLGGGAAPGIGFAIPSNTVKLIAPQLIASGHVTHSGRAFLGISAATPVSGSGVIVASVEKGGPADGAGIKRGDMIVSVDGKPTPTIDALTTGLAGLRPGQKVDVVIQRGGQKQTVGVTLADNPG